MGFCCRGYTERVVVVGAGISGLACAHHPKQLGIPCLVLEARNAPVRRACLDGRAAATRGVGVGGKQQSLDHGRGPGVGNSRDRKGQSSLGKASDANDVPSLKSFRMSSLLLALLKSVLLELVQSLEIARWTFVAWLIPRVATG
jgi:putative NAD(P)-binding protein